MTRRLVTAMFADVVGSTELVRRFDPEVVRGVMSRVFGVVRSVNERHDGTLEKFIGDAVLAVFGIPVAHEDDALRAVKAGHELHAAIHELDEEFARDRNLTIRMRVGIETGEVLAGHPASSEPFVTGDAVNLASRLQQVARPDETLIGPATFAMTRDALIVQQTPPIEAKGFAVPITAQRVLLVLRGAPGHARHADTPMVDREREQALLREAFQRAVSDQQCQLFTVLGPPGAGKSRLVEEFLRWTGDRATTLRGRCPSYGEGIALRPIAEMFEQAANVPPGEPVASVKQAITHVFEGDPRATPIVERAMRAMGISEGRAVPEETLWAIRTLLERLADRHPLVAVLDDVQWAKPTLLELLDHVTDWSRGAPIMIICLARPDLLELQPTWGGGKFNSTAIHLEPLNDEQADVLIRNLAGTAELPDPVRTLIVEASGGNPLFAEEIVSMLIEEAVLVRQNGGWTTTRDVSELSLPPTVANLIAARIDRLSEPERVLLERAALVGKVFEVEAVAALPPFEEPMDVQLHVPSLMRKDLLRPIERAELNTLRFRHALIREAAYELIPKETRSELHHRHADWLLENRAEREGGEEVAAYHLERAFRYREEVGPADEECRDLGLRAGRVLASAGRRAFARGDMPSTSSLLERSLALLPDDEPTRADLLADLAESRMQAADFARTDALYGEMAEIGRATGDRGLELHARLRRSLARFLLEPRDTDIDDLRSVAREAVSVLESHANAGALAGALCDLATTSWLIGDASEMLALADRAMQLARSSENWRALTQSVYYVGRAMVLGPTPCEPAAARMEAIVGTFAERPMVQASARLDLALLHAMLGRWEEAADHASTAREVFRELGQRRWLAAGAITTGLITWWHGDAEGAEREVREAYELFVERGEREEAALTGQELAKIVFDLGRLDEAEALIEEILGVMAPDDIEPQIEWRSLRALVLASRGSPGEAERLSAQAEELVGRTDFVGLHGSVLLARARMFQLAGRVDEAVAPAEGALDRFKRKGNWVWASKARDLLDQLSR